MTGGCVESTQICQTATIVTTAAIVGQYRRMAVPRFYDDVAMTCGASRAWTLFHVDLRVAARQIFGGVRVSAAYVFATAATQRLCRGEQRKQRRIRRARAVDAYTEQHAGETCDEEPGHAFGEGHERRGPQCGG